jgi:histone deacetylase complex regulatory component SIN3
MGEEGSDKHSKTIKEVYGQVAALFRDQQDLLDEFRQFLPEPSAPVRFASNMWHSSKMMSLLSRHYELLCKLSCED